jgi:hypothetical protein
MRQRPIAIAVPTAIAALLLLAGCVQGQDDADPATSSTPSPSATPSATPTPSASAGDAIDGTPVTVTCNELVTPQAMYDYNPNYSLKADYKPAVGSLAAQVVTQKGLACAWVNQTSGELIEVSVANLPAAHLTQLKNDLVTTSNSVPTYEVEGYFKVNGSTGEAQAFSDPYWIVATSTAFFEPGDAQPIVAAAIAALG